MYCKKYLCHCSCSSTCTPGWCLATTATTTSPANHTTESQHTHTTIEKEINKNFDPQESAAILSVEGLCHKIMNSENGKSVIIKNLAILFFPSALHKLLLFS
jgi:hypothetical protein